MSEKKPMRRDPLLYNASEILYILYILAILAAAGLLLLPLLWVVLHV